MDKLISFRTFSIFIAVLALLVASSFLIPATLRPSEAGGFADKIAGTYFVELDDGVTTRITSLTALTPSSGGWFGIISSQFSGGAGAFDPFSDQQGVWEQTGKQEIEAKVLDYTFDSETKELAGIAVITYIVTFSKDLQTLTGHADAEIFTPDVDPIDPQEAPTETFSSNFTGKRLNVGDD